MVFTVFQSSLQKPWYYHVNSMMELTMQSYHVKQKHGITGDKVCYSCFFDII